MRVLIVDDHPLVADAFSDYLREIDAAVQVVFTESFRLAMDWLERGKAVDLVLLDYKLPDVDGLEGLSLLRRRFPELRVILVSGIARRDQMREALARGAAGVIPKDFSAAAIVNALELILAGEVFVPAKVLSRGAAAEEGAAYVAEPEAGGGFDRLTARQRQVLALLKRGYSNKRIAQELGTKEITAAYHLKGIYKKLGVRNRTEAVAKALSLDWKPGRDA